MFEFSAVEPVNGRRMKVFLVYEKCRLGSVHCDVARCLCRVSNPVELVSVPMGKFVEIY